MVKFSDAKKVYGSLLYDYALSFREISLAIHTDPNNIQQYINLPAIAFLLSDDSSGVLERTKYLEALSYGDPGVLLASPGPSLSGIILRELGSVEQKKYFYDYVKNKKSHTCFALTEPNKGSDAANIETKIKKRYEKFYLSGSKCFFGNGVAADIGVVFCRATESPVGVRALLLKPESLKSDDIVKTCINHFPLKGARLSSFYFNNLEISEESILGLHLSDCENGILAFVKVFNQYRTGVGAMAIGQARGVLDLCYQKFAKRFSITDLMSMYSALDHSRAYLHEAAKKVDQDKFNGVMASAAKKQAVDVAERIVSQCVEYLSFDDLHQVPWIVKSYADIFCFEFMEGTSNVHRKTVASSFKKNYTQFGEAISHV